MKDKSLHRRCPACQQDTASQVGKKNDFQIFVCRWCRTLFTDQLPQIDEAENYDEYYSESNLKAPEFIHQRLMEIITGFSRYRQTNRFLDIGFGAGTLLQTAAELDWDVFGVEVSEPAIRQAVKMGFNVFKGDLTQAAYPDNYFDVVTASEIIEHLFEPQDLLKEVARILRPGGLFWATTPSAKGISYRLMGLDWSIITPPEHIQLFSKKGMKKMLVDAGFSNIDLRTHGTNPMEIVHFFRRQNNDKEIFSRVESGYQLNESMQKSPVRKKMKNLLNHILNFMQSGDSLKIYAEK